MNLIKKNFKFIIDRLSQIQNKLINLSKEVQQGCMKNIILTNVILLFIGVIIGGLLEYRYRRLFNIEVEKTTEKVIN